MSNLNKIDLLIKNNKSTEALIMLDRLLKDCPTDYYALFLQGKAYWRLGKRAKAISAYEASVAIASDSPARYALEQAREVEDFFNPDLLNP